MYVFGRVGRRWGGLVALGVYAATPTFLAFGPLVHTDVVIALFSLLTLWTFADLYGEPSRRRVWIFAACLAERCSRNSPPPVAGVFPVSS